MKHYYKFKFYINALHSVHFNSTKSNIHPHTWETVIFVNVEESDVVNFTKFEEILEEYFDCYEGRYLNDLGKFKDCDPTMEAIGKKIYEDLLVILADNNLDLNRIEISENPTRTYIIEK